MCQRYAGFLLRKTRTPKELWWAELEHFGAPSL